MISANETLKLCLKDEQPILENNKKIQNTFFVAAMRGSTKCVERLANEKPELVGMTTPFLSRPPVSVASYHGQLETVRYLVQQRNASVNSENAVGRTPLLTACYGGAIAVVQFLLRNNAKLHFLTVREENCLMLAVNGRLNNRGSFKTSFLLLQMRPEWLNITNDFGQSVLFLASFNGNDNIVNELIQFNANVNQADIWGKTPIFSASHVGYIGVAQILIASNADVNQADVYGSTPIFIASENGFVDVVNLFAQYTEWNPLMNASFFGQVDVAKDLLENNQTRNVNLVTDENGGYTSLYAASFNGYVNMVNLLLTNNAATDIPNVSGRSPLFVASRNGHAQVVETLIKNNATIDQIDLFGDSPLTISSYSGHFDVVKMLAMNEADINHIAYGETALQSAKYQNHKDIVEFLSNYTLHEEAAIHKENL